MIPYTCALPVPFSSSYFHYSVQMPMLIQHSVSDIFFHWPDQHFKPASAQAAPRRGGKACLFEEAPRHDCEDGGGCACMCMRRVRTRVWACATLFRWRAQLFHVTKYVSNKRGRRAACELLDCIRGLQIDWKRIVVSIGKWR